MQYSSSISVLFCKYFCSKMSATMSKEAITLRSRQLNPCDVLFWKSRGYVTKPENWQDILVEIGYYDNDESGNDDDDDEYENSGKEAITLRSRQLNPCDVLFWQSRGYVTRPENWQDILVEIGYYDNDENGNDDDDDEYESSGSEYSEDEEYDDDEDEYEEDDKEYEEHRENSNEQNPNNDAFWQKRGFSCRPDNWQELRVAYAF